MSDKKEIFDKAAKEIKDILKKNGIEKYVVLFQDDKAFFDLTSHFVDALGLIEFEKIQLSKNFFQFSAPVNLTLGKPKK